MRVLLIGPYPPPHGGVSVHIAGIQQHLLDSGIECRVLDTGRQRPGLVLGLELLRRACQGWTLHLHTNGHNPKSWLLALWCALTGLLSRGCIVTLHSGMAPAYLDSGSLWRRALAGLACRLARRILCASPAIREAILRLGVAPLKTEVLPAFVKTSGGLAAGSDLMPRIVRYRPLLSTVLFFRPEYGFNSLVTAIARLRIYYPYIGCLVMGGGEDRGQSEQLVRAACLEDSVLLLGDLDHETCLSLMAASDAFVRPALEDGDSISVREALSLGLPVVASRAGMRPDGALLFHPGDVDEMIGKIKVALTVKRSGRRVFENCTDRLVEIYQQVDGSEPGLCLN